MEKLITAENTATAAANRSVSPYQKIVLNILSKMEKGWLTITVPDGTTYHFGNQTESVRATIAVRSNNFFKRVVLFGDIGFGESYVDGEWDTDNITNVISWMILNVENNPAVTGGKKRFSPISLLNFANKMYHTVRENSKSGSRKNISEHYDLNNEFFKLWLDESMTYSSAIFPDSNSTLHEGQIEKYDRICRELNIKDTDHILEIGTGWGGFCTYAAEKYGCKVTTVTISKEQHAYAAELVAKKGLSEKINLLLTDYRDINGRFDKIVSIEMLEAVGHKYLPAYFSKINELLKNDGAAAIQVITSHDSNYERLRKGVDWIQKHIFPGSLLPSVGVMMKTINRTGNLHLHDLKNFGLDYARTLREWREKFHARIDDVRALNFSDPFIRKWNYYLSYCEAAFTMRNISVVQMVLSRPNNRNL